MRPLFKDAETQGRFDRDGYAVVSFLDADEIRSLLDFYASIDHGEISDSLYVSSNTVRGEGFVRHIYETVKRTAEGKVARLFQDCRIITGSFLVKKPNPRNRVLPHQDWTTVDESRYTTASVWTALTDIGLDRGALGTIAGSHRFFSQVLCSPSALSYRKLPYAAYLSTIFPYMGFRPLAAGEAIVFDNRVIHGSLANTTSEMRMAASVGIAPAEATLYHHYVLPETGPERFEKYEVDEDFFCRYNNTTLTALHKEGGKPAGLKSLGVSPLADFTVGPLERQRVVEMIEAAGNTFDPALASTEDGTIFGRT